MGMCPLINGRTPVPTGVAIRDAREQLFSAAERVLLRDGPSALTSRAVTTEAGCAKGVLHRHFADFDAFLAELVGDRVDRLRLRAYALQEAAGPATVAETLSEALTDVFPPVAVAMVGLIPSRDELRARLRTEHPRGVPLLSQAAEMTRNYLTAERQEMRVKGDADVDTLAPTLVGAAHMLFADRTGPAPSPEDVRRTVASVLAAATP